jgi:hypothetical protein
MLKHFCCGGGSVDLHAKRFDTFEFFEIPAADAAHIEEGLPFGLVTDDSLKMFEKMDFMEKNSVRNRILSREVAADVFSDPRLAHGTSGDEDAIAVGVRKEAICTFSVKNISISDD